MRIDELNNGNNLTRGNLLPASAQIPLIQGGVTYPIVAKEFMANFQFYIDPHYFGAKGDAVGNNDGVVTNGNSFFSPSYPMPSWRIGQTIFVAGVASTITGVNDAGVATLSPAVSSGNNVQWLVGTDDTAAIHAALQAAKTVGANVGNGTGSESFSYGPIAFGGVVMLHAGRGYIVRNTQANYDAGRYGAINIPKRCGLAGGGRGQTHVYLAPGNIGHGITNENSGISGGAWSNFIGLRDLSLFCNPFWQTSACLDGVRFALAGNNYSKTDVFTLVENVHVFESRRDGFSISGRGENVLINVFAGQCFRYGIYTNQADSRLYSCNAGGNAKTGIRIDRSANTHLTNCKGFYSGSGGGSNAADCANFALVADSFLNGQCLLTGCEAQESRGSGFYIDSGLNMLVGCLSADPSRAALASSGTPPAVRAGFHLASANARHNLFSGCFTRPALTLNYSDYEAQMYAGTHAVYVETAAKANRGAIHTFDQAAYDVDKLGGGGLTSGLNTGLMIDGVALT